MQAPQDTLEAPLKWEFYSLSYQLSEAPASALPPTDIEAFLHDMLSITLYRS